MIIIIMMMMMIMIIIIIIIITIIINNINIITHSCMLLWNIFFKVSCILFLVQLLPFFIY